MSGNSRDDLSMPARWKRMACAVAAFVAVGLSATTAVQAQDATPAGSPSAAECVAPELPPGSPTPMDMASPEAVAGHTMATSMAEEATQEATAADEDSGTPAEGDAAAEIIAAAENIIGCVNGGDYEGAAALMTDNYIMSEFGTGNPYDVAMFLDGFVFAEATVDNPRTYEDGSVSADVTFMMTPYQLAGWTFRFVQDGEYWKADDTSDFAPDYEGDSALLGVNLTESEDASGGKTYAFTIAGVAPDSGAMASVTQQEVLVLHGINQGTEDHEIAVVKLPEGADPMGILDGSIPETEIEFIGQIELAPGEQRDMVLQGLPAGVYTMVCFFNGPDGQPHAAHGMVAQFEVTAPAS